MLKRFTTDKTISVRLKNGLVLIGLLEFIFEDVPHGLYKMHVLIKSEPVTYNLGMLNKFPGIEEIQ